MKYTDEDVLALEASCAAYSLEEDVVKVMKNRSCKADSVPQDSILRDTCVLEAKPISDYQTGADCLILLCRLNKTRKIVIAFRGTELSLTEGDILADVCVTLDDFECGKKVKVIRGFRDQYESLTEKLQDYLKQNVYDELLITGHSLGGALATLCAVDIASKPCVPRGISKTVLPSTVTFASPLVGNKDFKKYFEKLDVKLTRFVNDYDPVPKLPGTVFGYAHVGKLVQIRPPPKSSWIAGNLEKLKFIKTHSVSSYKKALTAFKSGET